MYYYLSVNIEFENCPYFLLGDMLTEGGKMKTGTLFLFAAVLAVPLGTIAVLSVETTETKAVSSTGDLRSLLRESQRQFFMPSIPSTSQILWDVRSDEDIFVDWVGFKPSERRAAFAILDRNLIPRYEIHLWESPKTGIITVANMYGETMATLRPEKGFDCLAWAYDYFGTSELTAFQEAIHASWHTALSLTLTPYSFAKVCADIRDEEALLAEQASSLRYEEEGMAMMSMGAGVELQLGISQSNGTVEVFVEWLSSLDSDSLDLFHATDLIAENWQLETNFPTASSTNFYFQDLETNQTARFYVAGTDYDEDNDLLSSARERFVYKTREDLFDTDGDGLGDGFEVGRVPPVNPLDTDSDDDGLDDGWEVLYAFDPLSLPGAGEANADSDGDGFVNLEEYVSGADPRSGWDGAAWGAFGVVFHQPDGI